MVRYEYRARELNTDGTMITEPEGETSVNHAYSGSFSGGFMMWIIRMERKRIMRQMVTGDIVI